MIRTALPQDLPLLGPLPTQLGYPVNEGLLLRVFSELSQDTEHLFYVSVHNDQQTITGFLHCIFMRSLIESPHLMVRSLVVDERFRGEGIGKQLVQHTKSEAARLGADHVALWTNKKRLDAHRFYEREGFENYGVFFKCKT